MKNEELRFKKNRASILNKDKYDNLIKRENWEIYKLNSDTKFWNKYYEHEERILKIRYEIWKGLMKYQIFKKALKLNYRIAETSTDECS